MPLRDCFLQGCGELGFGEERPENDGTERKRLENSFLEKWPQSINGEELAGERGLGSTVIIWKHKKGLQGLVPSLTLTCCITLGKSLNPVVPETCLP